MAESLDLGDAGVGLLLLTTALLVLALCLLAIVKTLSALLSGKYTINSYYNDEIMCIQPLHYALTPSFVYTGSVKEVVEKIVNADLPYVPWLTGYVAILTGAVFTFLLQSSSIFTSTLTPLVGMGVITVERMYPLTLGSNLGTTTTAIFAALSADGAMLLPALQISLVHMFFNLSGILLWYPVPFLRFPIPLALALGRVTAKYRWFAVIYILLTFCILPTCVFAISLGGKNVSYPIYSIILVLALVILGVNVCQVKWPNVLPRPMRTWAWLPLPLRSLEPYDRIMSKVMCCHSNSNDYDRVSTTATNCKADPAAVVVVVVDDAAVSSMQGSGGGGGCCGSNG